MYSSVISNAVKKASSKETNTAEVLYGGGRIPSSHTASNTAGGYETANSFDDNKRRALLSSANTSSVHSIQAKMPNLYP